MVEVNNDEKEILEDPKEVLSKATESALSELDSNTPFLCVECGVQGDCIEDIVFHLLTEHNYVMCQKKDGKLIDYREFLEMVSSQMVKDLMKPDNLIYQED